MSVYFKLASVSRVSHVLLKSKPTRMNSVSLNDRIGNRCKSDARITHASFGDWKPKRKIEIDGSSSQKADSSSSSTIMKFDICSELVNAGIKPKAPLHTENRNNQKGPKFEWLSSGMVLMRGYISIDDQVSIVKTCRVLGLGEGGFYQPYGGKLRLLMMCLGLDWGFNTRQYSETRAFDNSKPPMIPDKFLDMVKKAIQDSNAYLLKNQTREMIPSMLPDICIVNFYTTIGRLGLHQDKDESRESLAKGLPVVSFSIGDTAVFLYNEDRDIAKAKEIELESGDVLIFGGKSRHIFHGVASVLPDTAPESLLEATQMSPGRLNLTFRQF